ncbi:hypothetical protein [Paraburkholderia sp.]|jgi:hypothetical protein|uniref:hypothetical protein n=1 Tax=Paraburkholderia sp. TaxID=1926495 RepID=UPI002F3E4907
MNKAILTVVTTGAVAAALCTSSVTFAQAGGNGQGGNGAGNAHGAATAGMTYGGDPISSPWVTKPAGFADNGNMPASPSKPMAADDKTRAPMAQQ